MMLCKRVRDVLKKYSMLGREERIAVAFSGGADSVALLHFLKSEGFEPSAIHINHGIRGEEADGDEEFCRDFCAKNSIPFYCSNIDVPGAAKVSGEGLEEAARRMRYAEIEKIVTKEGITRVATAHHADDNMETLIFNLTRGASLKGAGAIPPIRGIYIRPLIEATREEIITYCNENSLEYVVDSTNFDTDYTRNFIRHKIIPLIKQINPDAADSFGRFTACARRDEDFISSELTALLETDRRDILCEKHPALLTRYIYRKSAEFDVVPSQKSVETLLCAIKAGNEYKCVDLGKELKAFCDRNRVSFELTGGKTPPFEKTELVQGENKLGDNGILFLTEDKTQLEKFLNIYKRSVYTKINSDKIKGTLYVRQRENGDSYRYGGMTRSLKKLFNSKKISIKQRDILPLVCDEGGIVWIPSFPHRDGMKPEKDSEIIYIGYIGEKNDNE